MKKNFIRMAKIALITASALAFMNCSDESGDGIANPGIASPESSSSVASVPVIDPVTGEPVIDPITGEPVLQPGADVPLSSSAADTTVLPPTEEIPPSSDIDVPGNVEPVPGESSSSTIGGTDPETPVPETPASSSSVETPTVDPAVSSSSEAPVVSSSSEKVESSSSVAPVPETPKGIFLAEGGDENKDYLKVSTMEKTGPDGGAILAWPEQLSETQKHGVVVWGPGGGTEPGAYLGIINRLASHGFVVIALSSSPGDGNKAIAALDWLEKISQEPGKPLYNKIDFTKVGCSGHSMGGLESEQALIKDKRVIAAMLNNSGDLGHSAMASVSPEKHIGIVYGEGGMERPNAEADYNNPGVKAPACLIKMTGGQGNECQQGECGWGHGSGPWGGMAATVAWMRWHLGGEDNRKADFVGTSGKYINGSIIGERGNWKGQCKNF